MNSHSPNSHSRKTIEIREVSDKRALNTFIQIPWQIYKDDPNWVPPLLVEQKQVFSSKNPFFKHAIWRAWIAYQDGKPVGRISAQIDELHQQRYQDKTGFFGLIEAPDDGEIFLALFETAESWLRENGMRRITGPYNLGINQMIGILIDGFDSRPYVMTSHSARYYGAAIESCGYQPVQDLLAYQLDAGTLNIPRIMRALIKRSAKRVKVRAFNRKMMNAEFELMRDIFNDAWQNNWDFVAFTPEEFSELGKNLLKVVPDDFIQFAEIDGEAAAFIVLLPDINEVIADLNGRLLPFGWARLLWRLKVAFPKAARVPLMGVRQKYQNSSVGPAMAYMVIEAAINAGIEIGLERVEMSWVLDHNKATRNIIESVGGEITKRYRMYEKDLYANELYTEDLLAINQV